MKDFNQILLINWPFVKLRSWLNIIAEHERNYLGVSWLLIEPLLYLSIYFIVFSYIIPMNIENYVMFLLLGISIWMWFLKCITRSVQSLISAKNILNNIKINPLNFIVIPFLHGSVLSFPLLIFSTLYCLITTEISFSNIGIVVLLLFIFSIIIFSFCILFSLGGLFFPDLSNIMPSFMTGLLFLSGVFYQLNNQSQLHSLLLWSPIASFINTYRNIVLSNNFSYQEFSYLLIWSILILLTSLLLYSKSLNLIMVKINE